MTVVIDASVVGRWYFPIDGSPSASDLLRRGERVIAPDLLIPEFTNATWKAVVFGQLPVDIALEAIADFEHEIDEFVPSLLLKDRALAIALELRHSAYDCFYLALAEVRRCSLVTADQRLLKRCAGTRLANLISRL
jgi:predicted nucleic acid-binding protein